MLAFMPEISTASDRFDIDARSPAVQVSSKTAVHLYFSDKENSFLIAEERTLFHPGNPVEFGQIIVENLIQGPREGLMGTIPPGTALRAVYLSEAKTAYVDVSTALKNEHPGGIQSELMTIFSIVNSLILNVPEIETVKILINGQESATLAGHIDLRFPIKANMLLIR
ncbi:MAG: GerMN domain-containing protein [Proteobacteria bacterium]|nr:GerMN domain-containing protein [Pseudomonadota bacterium]